LPPHMLVSLHRLTGSSRQSLVSVGDAAAANSVFDTRRVEFYVAIHDRPLPRVAMTPAPASGGAAAPEEAKEDATGMIVNFVPHMWLFRGSQFTSEFNASERFLMGIFSPFGIGVLDDSNAPSETASAPIEVLLPRVATLHHCRFSPNNAQLRLLPSFEFHSFFSLVSTSASAAADHKIGGRHVLTFHVVAGNQRMQELLRAAIKTVVYVTDLLEIFHKMPSLNFLALQMEDLLRPLWERHG